MHSHEISNENETRTLLVIILTVVTMAAEIAFGYITKSMSLLADGFHMGTHALALGLTFVAYILARKYQGSALFPKGTGKIGTLTAYTSSIFLGLTGIWIIAEAFSRFIHPLKIEFSEAILIAVIGLAVNTVCIFIMEYGHKEGDKDYNYKAAYYHILSDALTSILAITALILGKYFNIVYFDSFVGILGGLLILKWAGSLIKNTVKELVDMTE